MVNPVEYHIGIDIYNSKALRGGGSGINNQISTDYRLSAISEISVDMEQSGSGGKGESKSSVDAESAVGSRNRVGKRGLSGSSIEPLKAKHVGYGVIRLYREPEELTDTKEALSAGSDNDELAQSMSGVSLSSDGLLGPGEEQNTHPAENTMVSILAIPSYFTATDILGFIGDDYTQNHLSNVRILRSDISNRFLVLLNFRSKKYARKFRKEFNGKHFNSMEPETCHVIYVKSVMFRHRDKSDNNYFLDDPFTGLLASTDKPVAPSTANLLELPTCPVCLERMDSALTGLLTIPCQHTFHCQCLSKWQDDSCPICRYSSSRQHMRNLRNSDSTAKRTDKCNMCGIAENLWICLICGNIACGRYNQSHAVRHYEQTGHCFAMDINTQRIWDYAGDAYVHRLLTTEADGKLVELPSRDSSGVSSTGTTNDSEKGSKGNTSYVEYSHILISQLESQREFYEAKINDLVLQHASFTQQYKDLIQQFEIYKKELESLKLNTSGSISELLDEYVQQKKRQAQAESSANAKHDSQAAKIQKLHDELRTEKALSSGMLEKIKSLEMANGALVYRLRDSNQEKVELRDQLKDVMFYLETQSKLKDAPEDVREGTVVMQPSSSKTKKKRNK